MIFCDWYSRCAVPAVLRNLGHHAKAEQIESCAEIVDAATAEACIEAARSPAIDWPAYTYCAAVIAQIGSEMRGDHTLDALAAVSILGQKGENLSIKTKEGITLKRSAMECLNRLIAAEEKR
jgi:hypothetical protein